MHYSFCGYFLIEDSYIKLLGIECPKSHANTVKNVLQSKKLLNFYAKTNSQNDNVIFPLIESISSADQISLSEIGLSTEELGLKVISSSFRRRSSNQSNIDQLMKESVPKNLHDFLPRSFDLVGELLLVKLDPQITKYQEAIASVYLSAFPIRAVYNKIADVQSLHRVASWECIGGVDDTLTSHSMNGITFFVDIAKAYFNSRLNNEYLIVSEKITDDTVVWDLFCGIGPFTLTLASKRHVTVHANDINPEAITLLEMNIVKNKNRLYGDVLVYNKDANEIIATLPLPFPDAIFMNLPETATDYVSEIFNRFQGHLDKKVTIFVYYFVHKMDSDKSALANNSEVLKTINYIKQLATTFQIQIVSVNSRIVRDVSPSKSHVVSEIVVQN